MQSTISAAISALTCVAVCTFVACRMTGSSGPEKRSVAVVAYVPNAKKETFFAALRKALAERGIRLCALRSDGSLAGADGPPSSILHKLTDDIALAAQSPQSAARLAAVEALLDTNPSIVMLDPLSALENVRDRRAMAAAVQNLPALLPPLQAGSKSGHENDAPSIPVGGVSVRMPPTVEVLAANEAAHRAAFPPGRPLVVKSAAACSTPEAHYMAIIESWEQLESLQLVAKDQSICPKFPVVVQPYVPHGGVVHKVYVVGSALERMQHNGHVARYFIVPKPSLSLTRQVASSMQDLCSGGAKNDHSKLLLLFDALHPARTPAGSALFRAHTGDASDTGRVSPSEHPPDWLIEALNRELQCVLGLTFFGYDLIREEGTGHYWILDVNYFPSYTGCEGAVAAVADSIAEHLPTDVPRTFSPVSHETCT